MKKDDSIKNKTNEGITTEEKESMEAEATDKPETSADIEENCERMDADAAVDTADNQKAGTNATVADGAEPDEKRRKKKKEGLFKKINKRVFRKQAYSAALSVVVIAVVVVLNILVGKIPVKYTQFDISTGKLFTIGEETKAFLDNLDEDITIYYIVEDGNEDTNVEKLLEQYEAASSHIKVEKKKPSANPEFVSNYTDEEIADNSLIVEAKNRNKIIAYNDIYETELDYTTYQETTTGFDGEGQLTSAIAYVISDDLQRLYYVEGHNEVGLPADLRDRIERANIELEPINLLTSDSVPADGAAILLNSPQRDYSDKEAQKVMNYLKNGGRAIMITDYVGQELPNYWGILKEYGIEVTDGIVIEKDSDMYVQQPYNIVPEIKASAITQEMTGGSSYVLLAACQGFCLPEDETAAAGISQVLAPSKKAYVKSDPQNMKSFDKEDGDKEGSYTVAALIEKDVKEENGGEETEAAKQTKEDTVKPEEAEKTTKIACFSSSSILDSSLDAMVSGGNYNLYMNSVKWLADSDDTQLVSIPAKSVAVERLTVTTGKAVVLVILLCGILPIGCLIVGAVVCHRRKKR